MKSLEVTQLGTPRIKRRKSAHWNQNGVAYLFLSPWLLGFFGLAVGPILASLYLSFTNYNLLTRPKWIGIQNYSTMLGSDSSFYHSLGITLFYVVLSVPAHLIFALLIAVVLNRGIKGVGIYRTVYYIPSLLGGSVAIALVWKQVFGQDGAFNQLLSLFGIKGMDWVSDPKTILYTIVVLAVWQFGSAMLIFLAGLKQIPKDIYESAEVDGASKTRQFFTLTLPLLTPTIFFNLVMGVISSFQIFTSGYVIGDGRGGPIGSTLFYTLYLYLKGFSFFDMGYASALAWIMLIIIGVLTLIIFATQKYWVFYSDGKQEGK